MLINILHFYALLFPILLHNIFASYMHLYNNCHLKIVYYCLHSGNNLDWNLRELPNLYLDTGEIYWVRVSHVEDPELIYVHLLNKVGYDCELLETLKAEFEELIPDWHAEHLSMSPNHYIVGELYVYRYGIRTK